MLSDFNIHGWSAWSFWLIATGFMILHECWWIRYFQKQQDMEVVPYSSFYGILRCRCDIAGRLLLFLGLYGRVIWLIAAVIIGIGHDWHSICNIAEKCNRESRFVNLEERGTNENELSKKEQGICDFLCSDTCGLG